MSLYKELSYETDNDIETVKAIQFCILSPQEIERRSVVEVLTNESYNGTEPVKNGLFDSRMGVIENNKICGTCEQKNNFCPGHFGHIRLAKPVYHIQFFEYVHKVLKCVCFRCSKLVLDNPADIQAIVSKKHSRMKRFEMAYKLCQKTKRKFCDMEGGCRARRPDRIKKDGFVKIVMEWNVEDEEEPKKVNFDAEEVLRLLERISDEDAEILGFHRKFNRPEWMICTVLPVPPPAVRPSVRTETGQRMEDDITHKLNDIVKYNLAIKSRIEKNCTKEQIAVQVMMLQYHVATLVDNQIPGMSPSVQRTGRPLRSLFERLKSKEGRIRGNLMGKRVDFSARTVITPDPNISIDEIGVPVRIAMNLTFPDVVNEYNIEMLTRLVHNGPGKYPGAKYVKKRDPYRTIRLKNMDTTQIELEIGDVVDRHLINGDYVLFNRQPSLHKMSMQGHRVRVMPFDTFRLNVCVTKNYNADFDGDEMNVHAPQSLQTRNELIQLASVPTQIITPKDSKPIISIVQDVALGVYRITKSFIKITEKQMMNLMCPNPRFSGVLPSPAIHNKKIKLWSGRQALSSTIPVNVNFKGSNNSFDDKHGEDKENYVIIENGQIKQGRLDTKIYQDRTRGLVHSIFNEYGPEETRHFFDNTQQLICNWLVLNGFSVGISDLVVENDTNASLKTIIHDMKVKVYDVLRDIHMKKFQNESILNDNDKFEEDVNKLLNDAIQQAGKVGLEKIDDINNRMINMIKAGAKGNTVNISQMIACLGQQNIDGKRVAYGFDSRTLPHYTKYDDGPESRGFVESSFIKGLTPQEFFFHSMGGREGLIDTAVKSVTGDTPIIIIENGISKYVKIGDWIDNQLDTSKMVAHYPEDRNLELLDITKNGVFIPTTDEDGNVTWGDVTAITRHDPGTRLYKIKTSAGKSVIVTESKSLLTWNASLNKFKEVLTPDIKVGDYVPVTASLPKPPITIAFVDMREYFPKTESCLLPDKFELNMDNGIFIGLYLAEVSAVNDDSTGSTVSITNMDSGVQKFVMNWFDKFSIPNTQSSRINKIGGISSAVNGNSRLLARFLNAFVGNGSRNKYVPDAAFVAPDEFVIGLLNGYFSGDGTIGKTNVDSSSSSARLTEGISMLLSRLGIFGTVDIAPSHRISIRGQWARIFQEKISLLIECKNQQLQDMKPCDIHRNYNEHNDVVLDEIVEIVQIGVEDYPKMYDLTIPSTLNFGLANGLHVRDTSSTGYIQRKLVKAMEDCKVSYDMTVRNANGNIIQFLYGEDGIDAIKIESHPLFYISMTMEKMDAEYMISAKDDLASVLAPDVIQDLHKSDPKWMDKMHAHFKQLHADRDFFINKMFQGVQETSVMYPVSFVRIINNTIVLRQRFGMRNIMSDLSPIFVLEEIQKLCDSVRVSPNNKGTKLFEMLARMYLSPKQVIFRHGLDKTSFKQIIQQVKMRFYDSIVHPSEMVGVVAAQSIGEPLSQCTLNTFHLSGVGSASKATRGVPRIEELTRVTKNVKAPSVTVFLKPEHAQNKAICLQVKNKLETTTFKHIIKTSKIFFDPSDTETTISNDANVVQMYKDFQIENNCDRASAPWLLRLELDRQKMLEVGLTTIELNHALKNQFNNRISCIFSDDNAEDVIFRIKLYEDVSEETTDMLTDLKALESTILDNIILKGVEKLQSASLEKEKKVLYNPETRAFEKTFEYKLYTEGTNLLQVLCMPYIDGTRTVSNDVNEIYKIFGIEAARQCLYNEILAVITDAKVNVNYRHLALLVDTMTSKGAMMSIDRHGINKGDIGPLAKCSFEEVNDVLVKAGVFSEIDRVNGVSANIMLGQIAPCGTGDTEILIDESKLLPPVTTTKPKTITMNDDADMFDSTYTKDTVCHSQNFELKFELPEIVENIKKKKIVEVN